LVLVVEEVLVYQVQDRMVFKEILHILEHLSQQLVVVMVLGIKMVQAAQEDLVVVDIQILP
jgi:hypothetical protein